MYAIYPHCTEGVAKVVALYVQVYIPGYQRFELSPRAIITAAKTGGYEAAIASRDSLVAVYMSALADTTAAKELTDSIAYPYSGTGMSPEDGRVALHRLFEPLNVAYINLIPPDEGPYRW